MKQYDLKKHKVSFDISELVDSRPIYIYFIKSGNFMKIGKSEKPEQRIKQLQTGTPYRLELFAIISVDSVLNSIRNELKNELYDPHSEMKSDWLAAERWLHSKFGSIRRSKMKGEWFKITPELYHYILANAEKVYSDEKLFETQQLSLFDLR